LRRMLSQYTSYMPGTNFLTFVHPDDRDAVTETLQDLIQSHEKSVSIEFRMQRKKEEWAHMQGRATNLLKHPDIEGIVLNLKDISHAKKLEDQLMQSQKMEALGRLAGGVAHDFNNLLTAIQGYTDILLRSVDETSEEFEYLQQIMQASERAAALTQQLLAFSRQKTMQQQKILVNEVLSGMKDMLKRIIGDDVELDMLLSVRAGNIMADPIQVQQIVMNLAVNARDAMPGGGLLNIETDGIALSEGDRPGDLAGDYAILLVRDNGSGMTKEVEAHIFEPFFTTKGVGKGTGLGLSMVYGIVEQSGGHIEVDSVLGRGTTFRIYLPQTDGLLSHAGGGLYADSNTAPSQPVLNSENPAPMPPVMPTRRETILVVEDADVIRRLAQRILAAKGYQVLVASNGTDALRVAGQFSGHIHLMLTDVVMPSMNGVELAAQLTKIRPQMRVLFMSGYVPEGSHGSTPMQNTLQKPFTAESLVAKIREVLREAQEAPT
jgi:two-component system cell cycle sensor histidine kinase/response regulator CckA